MQCYAGPFRNDKQVAQFILHSALSINVVESLFGQNYGSIKLILDLYAKILDDQIIGSVNELTHSSNVNVIFRREPFSETIEKWIVFVSIAIGVFILILIVLALVKVTVYSNLLSINF